MGRYLRWYGLPCWCQYLDEFYWCDLDDEWVCFCLTISCLLKSQLLTIQQLRLTLPSSRRMQQCSHRFSPRNLPHLSRRRHFRLVPPTRRRIYRRFHPRRPRIGLRPTLRRLPRSSDAAKDRPGYPLSHHHCRLFHGTRMHDCRFSSYFCVC